MAFDLDSYINNQVLTGFLNTLHDAVFIVDADERYLFLNKAAEEADGYTSEELHGRTIKEIYGLNTNESPLRIVCRTHEKVEGFEYRYPANGKVVYHVCNAYPIFIQGEFVGAYAIQSNITSLKEILEDNMRLQQRLYGSQGNERPRDNCFDRLIGVEPNFVECINHAIKAAESSSSVFITGRTGTGKELFAKSIHEASDRKDKPFLAINCSAIPETLVESILFGTTKGAYTGAIEKTGLFEQAHGGTLFLDELNSMPLSSQAKLLRVLEEQEVTHLGGNKAISVDVRIISSSSTFYIEAIEKGQIREDLFYRLSVINIVIPDLVDRIKDIPLLTNHFINLYNKEFDKNVIGLGTEVSKFFKTYNWPGNVRQLRHCIESAMNFVSPYETTLCKEHLPQYIFDEQYPPADVFNHKMNFFKGNTELPTFSNPESFEKITDSEVVRLEDSPDDEVNIFDIIRHKERLEIVEALVASKGNVTAAAKAMGIGRQALIYKMRKHGIKKQPG